MSGAFVIRSRAIIFHEGRLLLVRHPHDTSFAALPGGHLDLGEGLQECLRREIVEELGVEPKIGRLLYVNTFMDGDRGQPVEFFFEVSNGADYKDLEKLSGTHDHEIAEIFWASPTDDVRILPQELAEDFRVGRVLSDTPRFIMGSR